MLLTREQAKENLQRLVAQYHEKDKTKALTESDVIQKYIEVLLRNVLGWDIEDSDRYQRELHTQAGRPDLVFTAENGEKIFIEAKKFGVITELEDLRPYAWLKKRVAGVVKPEQLTLPGLAIDRSREEQQAINYAFENGGKWAILTNFERLRLFNARRDWMVLSFETPGAYVDDFDLLWQLSYENILNGSLDYLSNQRHREDIDPDYLGLINRWRETLANDLLNNADQNQWMMGDDGRINLMAVRGVVQRYIDRLVLIRFAEDHLVIPAGTLERTYEYHRDVPYTQSLDQLIDSFFREFDKKHNSALFAYGQTDDALFSDDVLSQLISDLYLAKYRAMPADILGNTYEQYLGKALMLENGGITTRDNLETRKKQGSYYTPQVIVRYLVDNSLGRYLYGTDNGQPDGDPLPDATRKTSRDIAGLRVLDSACGSGSFLINAYYVLAKFYEAEIKRLTEARDAKIKYAAANFEKLTIDDRIEAQRIDDEIKRLASYPRIILETHLYGVDLDPQAAEIAVVNLMMRAMERQGAKDYRLPLILNQNVKVGNALIGLRHDDPRLLEHADSLATIRALRLELVATPNTDPKHDRIVTDLDAATTALYDQFRDDYTGQFTDLDRVRPFHWGIEFPEVFYDETGQPLDNPGFDVIVGNPPWEIIQPDLREFYAQFDPDIESKLTRKKTEKRIEELNAEDPRRKEAYEKQVRNIEETAAYFKGAGDYTYQGRGKSATHKLFLERMYKLLQNGGRLGYVVPSGIYIELGTKQLREMLLNEGNIQFIFSFSNERFFFPGVDHRFKFAMVGVQKGPQTDGFWATFRFNPRVAVAPDDLLEFLDNEDNLVYVRRASLEKFSPDSLSVMEFQTQTDYTVTENIYGEFNLIGTKTQLWNVRLNQELNVTSDRSLLNNIGNGIPLVEGKMIHQFDAFYAGPQYWVAEDKIPAIADNKRENLGRYRVAHRRIAGSTNERTLIAAVVPPKTVCEVNATVALIEGDNDEKTKLFVCSILNALVLDYVIRYKVATTLNMFYMYQLPMPRLTAGNPYFDAIVPRAARLTCTRPEFADLWQTVTGEAWDESKGATDPAARQTLRDEIDALVTHLYGLSRDEFDHILGTFPLVFPDDESGQVKRERLLTVYDDFAGRVKDWPRE